MPVNATIEKGPKAILIDFGGVLATEGFCDGLKAIARHQGLDPIEVHLKGMDAIYDSGYIVGDGSEAEFWNMLRESAGLVGKDADFSCEILKRFMIRPRMIKAVRCLRLRGITTAILSDQTDWLERLDARYKFFREFDHVFNSYRLGKGKRDPSLFTDVVAFLGINPHEALFVDDMLANVERAKTKGIPGFVFTDEEDFLSELDQLFNLKRLKNQ